MSLEDLQALLARELVACSEAQRSFFARVAVPPVKWRLSPWGDAAGGLWAVAVHEDCVLWYNDIEEGFNVSRFDVLGVIPEGEYWCNQDPLNCALPRLAGEPGAPRLGPPQPLSDD